jgi:hypothetical protein
MCNDDDLESDSELNQEFAHAADNPQDFDFGFENEREATGFANFGFDPTKAAELRAAETAKGAE